VILLISTSWIARITGMSHWCLPWGQVLSELSGRLVLPVSFYCHVWAEGLKNNFDISFGW
jgi:hypothetical protein